MALADDPVAMGLVASLDHPGGNVTGVAMFSEETSVKRVELMRELSPHARRLAVITGSAGNSPRNLAPAQDTGRELGFTVETISVDDPMRFREVLSPAALAAFDCFILVPDIVLTSHADDIVALIGASNKPAIFPSA
jgi:putative ABC transport system substrate-binding protein